MEFAFTGDLAEVAALAEGVFAGEAELSRVREAEAAGGFDAKLWHTLAASNLIDLALPEGVGGAGLGMLGLAAVLEQQGRRVAPVPLWSVVTQAALPIAVFGDEPQKKRWLPGIIDGSALITGSFELGLDGRPFLSGTPDPYTVATTTPSLLVNGELTAVPAGPVAQAFVVPVATSHGVRVAVIPGDRSGLAVSPLTVTNRESSATVTFKDVLITAADILPGHGEPIVERVRTWARIALAALAVGVCQEAVAITAAYTSQRVQFGQPLSTNQAVGLRAADAHLDTERIRLTAYKAAWHADRGDHEQARAASLVAKWWAATGGLRAVHATQHLHGGIGADVDYPIHRYFLWGRQIAFILGSAGAVESELGDLLDRVTPIGAPS